VATITATMTLPVNETQSQKQSTQRTRTTEAANVSHWHEDDWLGNLYIVDKDGTKEECIEKHRVYFYNKVNTDAEFK
jgi:hypothetical protein